MPPTRKTLVIGLGNPILTDDGIGVLAAEQLRERLPSDTPVELTEVSVGGLTLMESMVGFERVILIDAFQPTLPVQPGTIHRLSLEDLENLSPTQHSTSPHDANLVTALETGCQMGMQLPEEVVIFAVEVENVLDFGDQPTKQVADALPALVSKVLFELGYLSHSQ